MYTKEDFLKAVEEEALKDDLTAALYHAGDPRFLQMQGAIAQMLAMYSQQMEIAMQEPFVKSRDATVLADAAMKGLIFTAKPATVRIHVANQGANATKIAAGRYVIDAVGRYYCVEAPVSVPAQGTAELTAIQLFPVIQTHTVPFSYPFYAVEIERPKDGSFISTLQVRVNGEVFMPSYKFNGVLNGDKVFHVESDEYKRLYIKFGESSVVGVQPNQNDVIEIECGQCFGNIVPEQDSAFSLQYIQHQDENELKMTMLALEKAGTDEVDIATLRELCRYPAVYDDNAVFEGEFDKLLRKQFRQLAFLSIWNEQTEEKIRGAKVENINTLFYSFALPDNARETESVVKKQIELAIAKADDSYKTKFIRPVTEKIQCRISATIARVYDIAQVRSQILDVLLSMYGKNAFSIKQGKIVVKHRDITRLLSQQIAAFSDSRADFNVMVQNPRNPAPEVYRYMDEDSIIIDLTSDGYDTSVWGGGLT